jgi:hypothetical protein
MSVEPEGFAQWLGRQHRLGDAPVLGAGTARRRALAALFGELVAAGVDVPIASRGLECAVPERSLALVWVASIPELGS